MLAKFPDFDPNVGLPGFSMGASVSWRSPKTCCQGTVNCPVGTLETKNSAIANTVAYIFVLL